VLLVLKVTLELKAHRVSKVSRVTKETLALQAHKVPLELLAPLAQQVLQA
jgi:hypothetical protein